MPEECRFMIYNTLKNEFQFPSICETTEKGAQTCLFKIIGNDARKYRFEVRKIEKSKAIEIKKELKDNLRAKKIYSIIPNIPYSEIYRLVIRNRTKEEQKCK